MKKGGVKGFGGLAIAAFLVTMQIAKAEQLPGVDSRPPAPSAISIPLPLARDDPFQVFMPQGPFVMAGEDIKEMKKKLPELTGKRRSCATFLIAGLEAMRDRRLEMAREFFRRALASGCNEGFAAFYLGSVLEKQGDFLEAQRILLLADEGLHRAHPDHRYVLLCDATLGRVLFRVRDYMQARLYLDRVVQAFPDDLPHRFFLGASYLRTGVFESAIENLEKVVALAPTIANSKNIQVEALYLLGEAYFGVGQYPRAYQFGQQGLQLNPKHAGLQHLLSKLQLKRDHPERVIPNQILGY